MIVAVITMRIMQGDPPRGSRYDCHGVLPRDHNQGRAYSPLHGLRNELGLMVDVDAVKRRFESLLPTVDERMVRAKLDTNSYPPGAKVSKKQIAEINIRPDSFHGEWNYTIRPNSAVT